jgi:hypothetical protein
MLLLFFIIDGQESNAVRWMLWNRCRSHEKPQLDYAGARLLGLVPALISTNILCSLRIGSVQA